MFGREGEGVHALRFFNVAVIDVLGVALFGALIAWWLRVNVLLVCLVLFLIGIVAHRVFCVRTTWDRLIFG